MAGAGVGRFRCFIHDYDLFYLASFYTIILKVTHLQQVSTLEW